jgi:hypothetical protein
MSEGGKCTWELESACQPTDQEKSNLPQCSSGEPYWKTSECKFDCPPTGYCKWLNQPEGIKHSNGTITYPPNTDWS